MTYQEKLKDPRWLKVRAQILERANRKCENCGCEEEADLEVHHGYYEFGLEPWEYPGDTLWCLCNVCHHTITKYQKEIRQTLARCTFLQVQAAERAISAIYHEDRGLLHDGPIYIKELIEPIIRKIEWRRSRQLPE